MFTNGKTGNSGGTYVGEDLNRRSEALGASCHFVDMSSALMRSVSPKLVFSLCFKPSYVRRRVWDRLSLCCSDGPFRCAASASSLTLTHTRTRISIARDDARLLTLGCSRTPPASPLWQQPAFVTSWPESMFRSGALTTNRHSKSVL